MEPFQPFFELNRLQHEINRLFEQLSELRAGDDPGGGWTPNVDIFEAPSELVVKFELPGVDPASVQLSVNGGTLILRGNKPKPEPQPGSRYHCLERGSGSFKRVIRLGMPINTRLASAEFRDGLLKVTFPKVPNRRGEEVTIPLEVHG